METDLLAELIAQKHEVLLQLRQLSHRQSQIISEGDVIHLLGLLSSKQSLLGQLQKLENALDPFRQQDPATRRWRTAEDRLRTRQVAERCTALLEEIMLLERQSESDLKQRRNAAAERLEGMHYASEARSAYLDPASRSSRLDLSSE